MIERMEGGFLYIIINGMAYIRHHECMHVKLISVSSMGLNAGSCSWDVGKGQGTYRDARCRGIQWIVSAMDN